MVEVNVLGLITVIVILLSHTVAIASVIIKHGNRIEVLEQNQRKLESQTIPGHLTNLQKATLQEAKTRQMECTIANGKNLEFIREEIREVKQMLERHLTIHETESNFNKSKS